MQKEFKLLESNDSSILAPNTVAAARVLAEHFDNQRPGDDHPLNFESLDIPPGLVIYGKFESDPQRKLTRLRPSNQFWDQIMVPAILLKLDNNLMNPDYQDSFFLGKLNHIVYRREKIYTNTYLTLFRHPDRNKPWIFYPIILNDIYSDTGILRQKVNESLSQKKTNNWSKIYFRMKKLAYYITTGEFIV